MSASHFKVIIKYAYYLLSERSVKWQKLKLVIRVFSMTLYYSPTSGSFFLQIENMIKQTFVLIGLMQRCFHFRKKSH
jgi:hypothetical protein